MAERSEERLRTTFEEVPDLYDRARPTYPEELFDDLAELARLPEHARIVEFGQGTGKATVVLAERGYRVTAVKLGEGLAEVARRNLAAFDDVEVVTANFENWEPDEPGFDGVVAFTAFHWIAPEAKYARPAALLRPGGALAVVSTQHVVPADADPFFREVQEDYEAVEPGSSKGAPTSPELVDGLSDEIEASGVFHSVGVRRYLEDVVYDAQGYIDVLSTYSGNRAMAPELRTELFTRIRRRIESRPGGTIRKTYLRILDVAVRV